MLRNVNKVFIVTGGSAGIGEGCVRLFTEYGGKVAFCSNEAAPGKQVEAEVNEKGPGEAYFIEADCRDETQIQVVINKCLEKFGRIDCLINNVGSHPDHVPIEGFALDDLKSLMELNAYSVFSFSKYSIPHIRKTKGSIVNISSLVSLIGQWNAVTYAMTKGAINGLTKALAIDEAKYGVNVNAVCPGNIDTPLLHANAHTRGDYDSELRRFRGETLFNELGTTRQVAEACLFLCTEGKYCTGITLPVSGGAELDYAVKSIHN